MAKKPIAAKVNTDLLKAIAVGMVTHVSQDEAVLAGMSNDPPLVEVDTTEIVDGKAAVRLSAAGAAMLANGSAASAGASAATGFALISGAVLPPSKRKGGGSGAPKKYPFDEMEVGASFFVPATAAVPDPVKKLGSTVSSVNMRYAVATGEKKQVERTVRGAGNKAIKNADGSNQRETKTVNVYKQTRKYVIRPVVKGTVYGNWTAEADGALIGRVE